MNGLKRMFNRAVASVSMRFHVASANLWRDGYNPLRGLSITRAVRMLEDGERGAYCELQWLYRYIEMQDATLGALIERRTSAVQEMGWDVKVPEGLEGADHKLAESQADALREAYNGINNLKAAIEFLCMASFRGYSHLEVVSEGGAIVELAPVEQWYWVRGGLNGKWMYNEKSSFGATTGQDVGDRLFVIREVARPINRVALVSFIRKSMSQKDWDGFIETFGIPAVFIIAPPNVPADKEDEYQAVAESIASDARGVLPEGSDVKTVDNGARGVNPFLEHIKYQDEQVVLRGTGGKLTMLAESGSGTLGGNAHSETFEQVARAEATEITEILQSIVDCAVLDDKFPEQKHLAYFEISANEETDTKEVVTELAILSRAGYKVSADQVRERTGYDVEIESAELKPENGDKLKRAIAVNNRESVETFDTAAVRMLDDARRGDMQGIGIALAAALHEDDFDKLKGRLAELDGLLPSMLEEAGESEAAWEAIFASALVNGWGGGIENGELRIENGDKPGHEFRGNQWVNDAPDYISANKADMKLSAGFEVKSKSGESIIFDDRLKNKLDRQADGEARKKRLLWAEETVKSGDRVELEVKGEKRTYYGRVFKAETKSKGILVIVDTDDGYAFNYHPIKPSQLRRKMKNRLESEEQPPVEVLKAYAAAGNHEGLYDL